MTNDTLLCIITDVVCADVAHLVERHLAKVEVAGSSPVIRSIEKREYQRYSLLIFKQERTMYFAPSFSLTFIR